MTYNVFGGTLNPTLLLLLLPCLYDMNFQYPKAATAWAITENWVTTGWQQFLDCSHCPTQLNSTQLVLNMFRTPRLAKNWRFSVELS